MEILIKSFNRPYYLDRCLYSVYKYCDGANHVIKILDDGTPEKYLKKLRLKYPTIVVQKSSFYKGKVQYCEQGIAPHQKKIPIRFWINAVKETTSYFLLLEDDIWFTRDLDLTQMERLLVADNMCFLKLFWLGNRSLIQSKSETKKSLYTILKPKLYTRFSAIFYLFFKIKRFGWRKLCLFFGTFSYPRLHAYYTIYSVAGCVFSKDYFLTLWDEHTSLINEELQLYNALKYYRKHRAEVVYGRSHIEILRTGFSSSATSNGLQSETKLNMFLFNKILNDAWYQDEFDVKNNFPYDFESKEIEKVLKTSKASNLIDKWKLWTTNFKTTYRDIGCEIP